MGTPAMSTATASSQTSVTVSVTARRKLVRAIATPRPSFLSASSTARWPSTRTAPLLLVPRPHLRSPSSPLRQVALVAPVATTARLLLPRLPLRPWAVVPLAHQGTRLVAPALLGATTATTTAAPLAPSQLLP